MDPQRASQNLSTEPSEMMIRNREEALNFLEGLPRWANGLTAVDVRELWTSVIKTVNSMHLLVMENLRNGTELGFSRIITSYMIIQSSLLYFRKSLAESPQPDTPDIEILNLAGAQAKNIFFAVVVKSLVGSNAVTLDLISRINEELSGITATFRQDYAGYLTVLRLQPSELEAPTIKSLAAGSPFAPGRISLSRNPLDCADPDEPDVDEATLRTQTSPVKLEPPKLDGRNLSTGRATTASRPAGDRAANGTARGWVFCGCCPV